MPPSKPVSYGTTTNHPGMTPRPLWQMLLIGLVVMGTVWAAVSFCLYFFAPFWMTEGAPGSIRTYGLMWGAVPGWIIAFWSMKKLGYAVRR